MRLRDMGKHKKSHKKGSHLVIPGDGDPCPRCGRPMQIREHPQITAKHRRQPFHYSRWFCCIHNDCKTSTVMPPRYAVWHCSDEKRRYLEARFLGDGLAREREKEFAEANWRSRVGAVHGPTMMTRRHGASDTRLTYGTDTGKRPK